MAFFQYDSDILTHYPSVVGGVILARDMTSGPTPKDLQTAFIAEQQTTLQRIGAAPLSQVTSLAAWRGVFRSFGVDPTQYRSAAEALLRRLTKKGDIPSIHLLVDLGNLVSIRYALPVAVFDTHTLHGAVTVHFADGSERYTTLGQDEVEHPEPGEVVFSDETKLVIARRWCWRQSEQSAAQQETTQAIITVEAHHAEGKQDVNAALDDLLTLLRMYAGGNFISRRLDASNPVISDYAM
jgi:DNA/RNA-binding domain of Phe-tRNA-synthetase-like protein